jgi:hypothetical protein
MKKVLFLFIIAACLLQINAFAQKAQVGITGGITPSNIYGEVGGLDKRGDVRTGLTVGMLVDAPIGKTNFSFQPGIHYVQKGTYTNKTNTVKEADLLRYADLIANFVYYLGGKDKNRLYFGLGPQIGFTLPSKKIKIEDGETTEVRNIAFGDTEFDDYNNLDYGANVLAGVRFKNGIIFSVNYTFGLSNIMPTPTGDDHLRNGSAGIRIGYFFSNTPKEKKKKAKK